MTGLVDARGRPMNGKYQGGTLPGKKDQADKTPERQIAKLIVDVETARAAGHDPLVKMMLSLVSQQWVVQHDPRVPSHKVVVTVMHHFARPAGGETEVSMERVVRCGEAYLPALEEVVALMNQAQGDIDAEAAEKAQADAAGQAPEDLKESADSV